MGFDISLNELMELTQSKITLLGNIPPRDVLADGNTTEVKNSTEELLNSLNSKSRVILSCGGGMPPGVNSENITAFIQTVRNYSVN